MDRRRGSALLIVLGFLSFMVVSAVAFSIYMRSERVPSSVFRRKAVSRQLVHAAVARAIGDLDNAIRADPFPGIHSGDVAQMKNGGGRFFDEWHGRVFMPPNPGITACPVHNSANQVSRGNLYCQDTCIMAPQKETAAVLNLEALGYVPAPLFNDVRILSRLTWSAKWKPFDQGAGRYAYVAVNVSDYIDVNRLKDVADAFRSSGNRINMAAMFAGGDYNAYAIARAEEFRTHVRSGVVNSGRRADARWPFVSLLDFYLDMQDGYADCQSPFYRWIGESRSGSGYDGLDINKIKAQCFVTDSWYPPSPAEGLAGSAIIDLNHREPEYSSSDKDYGQPFPVDFVKKDNRKSLQDCIALNTPFFKRLADGMLPSGSPFNDAQNKSFRPTDAVLLKDYLDRDDTPTSLVLPCVERVPMVASMGFSSFAVNLNLVSSTRTEGPVAAEGGKQKEIEYTEYKLAPGAIPQNNQITAAIVFPFKRGQDINQRFIARALVRLFLVEETASGLRIANGPLTALRPSNDSEWDAQNPQVPFSLNGQSMNPPPFVISMVSGDESVDTAKDIQEQQDVAIGTGNGQSVLFRFNPPNGYENQIVFTKKVETEITPAAQPGLQPTRDPKPPEFCFNVSPFNADGTPVETKKENWFKEEDFNTTFGSRKFTLHAAVWIMIENENGDVVDLVPAIAQDDNLYNGINGNLLQSGEFGYDGLGNGYPLFRFRAAQSAAFNASAESPLTIPPGSWSPGSYCAVDPRFNWAPEDWLPRPAAVTGDDWVKWVTGEISDNETDHLLAENGRDTDVFMFVSNQGFLQSMGEFAFLPRITEFENPAMSGAPSTQIDLLKQGNVRLTGAELDASSAKWSDIAHADCAWRTYGIYGHNVSDSNSQNMMDFRNYYRYAGGEIFTKAVRDFGDRGVKVNPYSDNEGILMSAFAYTPYDWWAAAGTNTSYHSSLDASSNSKDGKAQRKSYFEKLDMKYTFAVSSSGSAQQAHLSEGNLKSIADKITSALRSGVSGDWQAYDNLSWYGNSIDPSDEDSFAIFLGELMDRPLHSVDRKFLYSYWRGCLANRQQLFLVFVRAESGALGSGGEGKVPPQQGGRAVALVWRDPETPIYPGKTMEEARRIDREQYVKYDTGVDSSPRFRKPHRTRILFYHQFD